MWCRLLARLGRITVLTREDNRDAIEAELPTTPERDRLSFLYHQLSIARDRWDADGRGKRAYYLLWQRSALRLARRMHQNRHFDLSWHLTWSNAWVGSVLSLMDIPFVWGPLGGGIAPPLGLTPSLGVKGASYEAARALVRAAGRHANPLARSSWRHAGLILVSNREMQRWLPKPHRAKVTVMPQYGLVDIDHATGDLAMKSPAEASAGPRTALFVGRLLAFKGGSLALRALAGSPGWRLVICGTGPDEARLRRLVDDLRLEDRVRFAGWLERSEIASLMRDADVLLFPSLHDESPATVLEARLCGLDVICLDRGGAPVLAGQDAIVVASAGGTAAVVRRLTAALSEVGARARVPTADLTAFSLDARAATLAPQLRRLMATNG
jgi:glycosyltransferase involved in cell wall biosynthesis